MSDLEVLNARLAGQLSDLSANIWPAGHLEECLRLALGGYNRAAGASFCIGGLDGALISTLPAAQWDLLLCGAAGLAVAAHALERISQFSPDSGVGTALLGWAQWQMERFEAGLEMVRRQGLQTSAANPYTPWEWED